MPVKTDSSLVPAVTKPERCLIYKLKLKKGEREWTSQPCQSYGEALAYKADFESSRYTNCVYSLHPEPRTTAEVIGDEDITDPSLFWYFDVGYHLQIRIDGDKITIGELPERFCHRFIEVINCEGMFAVINVKNNSLALPPVYKYIDVNFMNYAELMTRIPDTANFRELVCDGLYNLDSEKFVNIPRGRYLCNSYDLDSFMVVEDGLIYYCRLKDCKAECVSRGYNEILMSNDNCIPVQDAESMLWGWMDKTGKEIISCKYNYFNFFRDGYSVMKDAQKRYYVIDLHENVVIQPVYDEIEHYKYSYFFMRKGDKRAVFIREKQLTEWAEYPERYEWELKKALMDYYESFYPKRYEMPIAEYLKLFEGMKTEPDLRQAWLWMHPVEVEGDYPSSSGNIGWYYPCSGSIFDMSVELPVFFGEGSIGVSLDKIRLVNQDV